MQHIDGVRVSAKYFEEGKLEIPNLKKSFEIARKIMDFKPYFTEFATPRFVTALIPLLVKSKNYNHKEMLHKLAGPIKLRTCVDSVSYRMLLEDIYNWKRLKENKVSFKYQ